jgi:hypothetical protein
VSIHATPSFPPVIGQTVILQVAASSISAITSATLTINGQPAQLDGLGRARFTPATGGHFAVVASVTDADGATATTTYDLKVRDPNDHAAPAVA